jgi:hypothetical protein
MDKDMQSVKSIDEVGDTVWMLDGEYHRTDGPSVENHRGDMVWHRHGRWHRTDGPAIEYADGIHAWYLDGSCYTFDDWLDQNTELTDEEKVMMKLKYG